MSLFFGRRLKIKIGNYETEDLRIDFNVEKSLIGYPNLAKITIFNLSASSRAEIEEFGESVELFAGYNELVLLFKGDLINVVHLKEGTEWLTELYAGDKYNAITNSSINKSLPSNTTPEQIFNELVGKMEGVTTGLLDGIQDCINAKRSLLRSIQLSGSVKKFIDELASNCGFDYAIADGIIDTIKEDKVLTDEPEILINQSTGMLGSPERTEAGVNVKTLLNPAIKLGRRIKIEAVSTKINAGNLQFRNVPAPATVGTFKIIKIVHAGSLWDNKWESLITANTFIG